MVLALIFLISAQPWERINLDWNRITTKLACYWAYGEKQCRDGNTAQERP